MNREESDPLEEVPSIVCIGCTAPIPEDASFCPLCGAPMSATATTDPFKRIFAEGYTNRRFTSGTPRKWTFIATWFFGVVGLLSFGALWGDAESLRDILPTVPWVIFAILFYIRMYMNYKRVYGKKENEEFNKRLDDIGSDAPNPQP